MVIEYYGLGRYVSLRNSNPQDYINSYKLAEKNKDRVVAVILTNKNRLKYLTPVLNSLLDQTVRLDDINVLLPINKIPISKELRDVANFYFNCVGLRTIIAKERDLRTKIIIIRDDALYGKDFIELMVDSNGSEIVLTEDFNAILITPDFFDEEALKCTNIEDWVKNRLNTLPVKVLEYKEIYPVSIFKRKPKSGYKSKIKIK